MKEDCDVKPDVVKLESELILSDCEQDEEYYSGTYQETTCEILRGSPSKSPEILETLNLNLVQSSPSVSQTQDLTYMLPQFKAEPPDEDQSKGSYQDINHAIGYISMKNPVVLLEKLDLDSLRGFSSVRETSDLSHVLPTSEREVHSTDSPVDDGRQNKFETLQSTAPEDSATVSSDNVKIKLENEEGNLICSSDNASLDFAEISDRIKIEVTEHVSAPNSECNSSHYVNGAKKDIQNGSTENQVITSFDKTPFSQDSFSVKSGQSTASMSNTLLEHSMINEIENCSDRRAESCIGNKNLTQMPEPQSVISEQYSGPLDTGQKSITGTTETHFNKELYSCTKCTKSFSRKENFELHARNHSTQRLLSCGLCSAQFLHRMGLVNHYFSSHPSEIPDREESLTNLKTGDHLEPRLPTHSILKPFSCKWCPAKFKLHINLEQHSFVHFNIRPFSCKQCSECFKSKQELDRHSRQTHPNERFFSCRHCSLQFKSKQDLKQHTRQTHYPQIYYACEHCSLQFRSNQALSQHLRRHTNGSPFACEECSSRFKSKRELKSHLYVHSNERPFACEECSSRFKSIKLLKMHLHVHSNERPFSCEECSSRFKSIKLLKSHLYVHSNKRPFSCEYCSARFKTRQYIKTHLQITHSNKRCFSCEHCSATFKSKEGVKSHLRVHSNVKRFSCKQCQLRFKTKTILMQHVRRHSEKSAVSAAI